MGKMGKIPTEGIVLSQTVKIYRENYENLPERFARKIEQDIEYIQKAHVPGLKKIYLFGSCARGQVRSTSDIDLLIVTERKMQDRMLAAQIRWTLDEPVEGVRTDVVYFNEEEKSERTVFQKEVSRDRKLILEVTE